MFIRTRVFRTRVFRTRVFRARIRDPKIIVVCAKKQIVSIGAQITAHAYIVLSIWAKQIVGHDKLLLSVTRSYNT